MRETNESKQTNLSKLNLSQNSTKINSNSHKWPRYKVIEEEAYFSEALSS
jgi:hypothetical protein